MANSTNSSIASYYCSGLEVAQERYKAAHGYISVSVCIAGALSNALALAVLARPELAAPSSSLLAALAATDALVMLEYIPFALHTYVFTSRPSVDRYSYAWAVYILFHANFTQVFHTVSIWLTVTLAAWRYLAVYHANWSRTLCTAKGTRIAIIAAYVGSPLICAPLYFAFSVSEYPINRNHSGMLYVVGVSELARSYNGFLIGVNFWIYSVVLKLLPCTLLSVLSQRLVAALLENKRRRRSLLNKADKDGERTCRLLIAVLLLFLTTELPQGVLGLISVLLGETFFSSCYMRLAEVMDVLALTSSALNFPLYCVMSSQFRATFASLLRRAMNSICRRPQQVLSQRSPVTGCTAATSDDAKKTTQL